jgi:hypothetical protein
MPLGPPLPNASRRSRAAVFACCALLASCGGGGEDAVNPIGGGGGPRGGGNPIEDPPDLGGLEGFGVWPGGASGAASAASSRMLRGIVGYRNSENLAALYEAAGAAGGLYRRTWTLHDPNSDDNIGEDFLHADAAGMRLWLHVVGTPADLSPHPELTGNTYGTGLPEFARFPPTDPVAWADRVLAGIASIESVHGVTPEYVEIWNEVERVEWFTGTVEEVLELYAAAAERIHAVRPQIKVGGPALAGWRSAMGGEESVVFALLRHVAEVGAPLDFVSWHHYAPANEILISDMPARCKSLATSLGIGPIETIVSEWNLAPSAQGALGPDFDGSHAAANYAGFLTTATERGLDGSMFFLDVDEDNDPGIIDLAGVSLGALTLHGIKKPVFRVMEESFLMLGESAVPVYFPEDEEFNLRVLASRRGNRTRMVISNDVVTGVWVYTSKARQYGMEPGWLTDKIAEAGGPGATVEELVAVGLTQEQAEAVKDFLPLVVLADQRLATPRETVITVLGKVPFRVGRVVRFDDVNNAPASHRQALLPQIQIAANAASHAAAEAAAIFLGNWGYSYTTAQILAVPDSQFLTWASGEGIPFGIATSTLKLRRNRLRNERFASAAHLNALPNTTLHEESAFEAGIVVDGRKLRFTLDPDAVLVVDLMH